jgi:thiamine biosynthesis protein ThiS
MLLWDRPALLWVTDRIHSDAPLPELAQTAMGSGIDLVQVREPGLDRLPLELLVRAIATVAGPTSQVVVNSDIGLARKLGVGVHLPESGPSIKEARAALGTEAFVGRSVHSPEAAANSVGASYLIAGHVFATASKVDREPLGIDRFQEIVRAALAPVLAIGGITPERVSSILDAGAAGVAIMSPFTELATIQDHARAYRAALEQYVERQNDSTITVTINGKTTTLASGTSISDFLAGRELHERLVVVERNGVILKRSTFPDVIVEEGDLLEIVHFVGGG